MNDVPRISLLLHIESLCNLQLAEDAQSCVVVFD